MLTCHPLPTERERKGGSRSRLSLRRRALIMAGAPLLAVLLASAWHGPLIRPPAALQLRPALRTPPPPLVVEGATARGDAVQARLAKLGEQLRESIKTNSIALRSILREAETRSALALGLLAPVVLAAFVLLFQLNFMVSPSGAAHAAFGWLLRMNPLDRFVVIWSPVAAVYAWDTGRSRFSSAKASLSSAKAGLSSAASASSELLASTRSRIEEWIEGRREARSVALADKAKADKSAAAAKAKAEKSAAADRAKADKVKADKAAAKEKADKAAAKEAEKVAAKQAALDADILRRARAEARAAEKKAEAAAVAAAAEKAAEAAAKKTVRAAREKKKAADGNPSPLVIVAVSSAMIFRDAVRLVADVGKTKEDAPAAKKKPKPKPKPPAERPKWRFNLSGNTVVEFVKASAYATRDLTVFTVTELRSGNKKEVVESESESE